MYRLYIDDNAPRFIKECAVEVSAILGFHSESLEFPVLRKSVYGVCEREAISISLHADSEVTDFFLQREGKNISARIKNNTVVPKFLAALCRDFEAIFIDDATNAHPLSHADISKPFAAAPLESSFAPQGEMESGYHPKPLFQGLEALFTREYLVKDRDFDFLPDYIDASITLSAQCDMYEVSAACDIAARLGMESVGLDMPILQTKNFARETLLRFSSADICRILLDNSSIPRIIHIEGSGQDLANMVSSLCARMPGTGDDSLLPQLYKKAIPEESPEALIENYNFEWTPESEECYAIVARSVYPALVKDEEYNIEIVSGSCLETRRALKEKIKIDFAASGFLNAKVRTVCAFKQGFSWISEYVVPELRALRHSLTTIDIYFSAFLPQDRDTWIDEDGATPKISADRERNPEYWFDSPIRLLQELYPIDDIVACELGIQRDNVVFYPRKNARSQGYDIIAKDKDGHVIYTDSFEISIAERPYLSAFPEIGKAHPGTGSIRVYSRGTTILQLQFSTDMEKIWAAYHTTVLPKCRKLADAAGIALRHEKAQPFFSSLILDLYIDGPDEPLGLRQDQYSSLDALHEDLYFVGLDYFKTLGIMTCGKSFDSPGLILPRIHAARGAPRLHARIQHKKPQQIDVEYSITVDSLVYSAKHDAYTALCTAHSKNGASPLSYKKYLLAPAQTLPEKDIRDIDLCEKKLIGYEEYLAVIEQLKSVPGLNVRLLSNSLQGRLVYGIEMRFAAQHTARSARSYTSRTKMIAARPTLYINARHHANEVSSTNSVFMLIRKLLVDPEYAGIAEKLNIVLVPMENADGAAIHYELAKEHPSWILHTARYNSLGKEIGYDYFNDNDEARDGHAFTRFWRDWLPDLVMDDHGVPSHEWCQPFSGYTSPWFKGFWMPRALLYGYFWYVTDKKYSANKFFSEKIQNIVAEYIGDNKEFSRLNEEWRERFEKYAHRWMPQLFPANYHKGLIFYWVPYAYKPDYYYTSVRFPWITASSFVTEVADETAGGDYLHICAQAHKTANLAVIDLMKNMDSARGNHGLSGETRVKNIDSREWQVHKKRVRTRIWQSTVDKSQ